MVSDVMSSTKSSKLWRQAGECIIYIMHSFIHVVHARTYRDTYIGHRSYDVLHIFSIVHSSVLCAIYMKVVCFIHQYSTVPVLIYEFGGIFLPMRGVHKYHICLPVCILSIDRGFDYSVHA